MQLGQADDGSRHGQRVAHRGKRTVMLRRLAFLLLVCAGVHPAGAATARELLDRVRQATANKWNDCVQRLAVRVVDRVGGERRWRLAMYLKKYPEGRTRSVVFFESPPKVRGVGVLQWSDPHAMDEQWLYLPALQRVRQISAGAKHASFAGTDLSYEDVAILSDMSEWTDPGARTTLLRDEPVNGRPCHVIEVVPAAPEATYGRIVTWLRANDSVMVKFELYDKGGQLDKRIILGDIRNVGGIPTPFRWEMENAHNGTRTVIEFTEIKYDTGLPDELFTQRSLEHGL